MVDESPKKKLTKKKTTKKKVLRKSTLGRGLDALLGSRSEQESNPQHNDSELQSLGIEQLQPGQYQPRSIMDQDKLQELADSIESQGIVQPIVVRKITATKYEIIAGERRWRAAQLAKLSEVPVLVKQVNDQQTIAMALIENIQREDLNPLEEALALARLIEEFDITHAQAAEAVGRSRVAVSNLLRLLELSSKVKDMLNDGLLEMGHARCLLPLAAEQQHQAAKEIANKKLSVRQAEALVKNITSPKTTTGQEKTSKGADITRLEQNLSEQLCAQVEIQHKAKGKSKLVIHYHGADELEGILARLK
ncbi:ParB/RepB/Spo0J family partition protein [Marinicella sp. S1101]|uniref:ParB/RepB/Spo0J family partition protein n=1 Tax=Marinicella marina TaxID=2996016 RepID=UPI002260B353|nr:ParB/RepB/Spo0J family partition protein [Marinicella marina]MCX7552464.1 ParB/RepB/Spo0J family partition protein [Marinicella marina]MDJ1139340.1 ParB/RepB/Spo0J family partition protein [Marinicella marina]